MTGERLPVLLDVDTGTDDALAILLALAHPAIEVRGVTCVAGNTTLTNVVRNTLHVLDIADAPAIPVAAGAATPLLSAAATAAHVHGTDGLAGRSAPSKRRQEERHAVQLMRDLLRAAEEPLTIVALAPQTNLALLLHQYPDVRANIREIVFMGGSLHGGNVTAAAEFNIWHDPEAASIVLHSGTPLRMYGLEVFNRVAIDEPQLEQLRRTACPVADLVTHILAQRPRLPDGTLGPHSGLIGDAGVICMLVEPDAYTVQRVPVNIELHGHARGQTLADRRHRQGLDTATVNAWPQVHAALDVDLHRAARVFIETLFQQDLR